MPRRFYTLYEKILKVWTLNFGKCGQKKPLKEVRNTDTKRILLSKAKFAKKQFFCGNFTPFFSKKFQILDHFFHYFSPRIPNLKMFGHTTSGSGEKKTFEWYLKSEHTHRQTDTHTHTQTRIWTNRFIESIGLEGQCFKKYRIEKFTFFI